MQREIKFRGYNDKKQWLYGDLLRVYGIPYIINRNINPFCLISPDVIDDIRVDPNTIGQFTGLHDCEGKEIYEGDIVTIGNNLKAVVIWFNGSFRFKDELSCKATYLNDIGTIIRDYDVCIIGNIHDNPELMKGGK